MLTRLAAGQLVASAVCRGVGRRARLVGQQSHRLRWQLADRTGGAFRQDVNNAADDMVHQHRSVGVAPQS